MEKYNSINLQNLKFDKIKAEWVRNKYYFKPNMECHMDQQLKENLKKETQFDVFKNKH